MPKYDVAVHYRFIYEDHMEIEAEDKEEAREKAETLMDDDQDHSLDSLTMSDLMDDDFEIVDISEK
jgi:hypothetical protein